MGIRISVTPGSAPHLEREMRDALAAAGFDVVDRSFWIYKGPPPASFAFGEGFIEFTCEAWKDLMTVPKGVEAIAKGIAEYMKKQHLDCVIDQKPDSHVKITFRSSGSNLGIEKATAQLVKALSKYH